MDETLGSYIKRAREAAGYTQEELASRAEVSQQSIAKWEANDAMPRVGNMQALARALDVEFKELIAARSWQSQGDTFKFNDRLAAQKQEQEIEAQHALTDSKEPSFAARLRQQAERAEQAETQLREQARVFSHRQIQAQEFESALFESISPEMMKGEREKRIEGGTITWRPDYVSAKVIAEIYYGGRAGLTGHMSLRSILAQRLWGLATLKAYLNDDREYLLILAKPQNENLEQIPRDTMVDRSIRRMTIEAAFLGVKVVVVQTAEEGAREIIAAELEDKYPDFDIIDDE